jgi:hypothetical protein
MQISPGRPGGTSWPASSRMAMSVEGTGRPMVPLKVFRSMRLQVATGEVSDMP